MDSKLIWKHYILKKVEQIKLKRTDTLYLTDRKSELSAENKLLIDKTNIKPIWTYGIELWNTKANCHYLNTRDFTINHTRYSRPWFVRNLDLKIESVEEVIVRHAANYKLRNHPNILVNNIYIQPILRRLIKKHPIDLTW